MDIKNKITEWINKNGYPFELRTAKSFLKTDFTVAQSIFYEDPLTKKFRETDIIAHTTKLINNVWVNLTFVVECKSSLDKPWVSFNNDEIENFSGKNLPILTTRNGRKLMQEISINPSFKSDLIYPNKQKMGYSLIRAFANNKDMAYTATQNVLSTVEYLVEKSNESNKKFMNIYFPLIAVEGELFEARISANDKIELDEVDELKISTIKSFAEQNSTFLTIFSSKNMDQFTENLKIKCEEFYIKYEEELNKVTKESPTNSRNFVI
ncbi:hypothetical protein [uncultured Christiangramia sp.]|uniref:hypothetical protein n=1 Tax=uncultured Christiangramia sp. TaxID=503836 RepID=UPI002619B713|nr:hypothetical protein [uncultured Christiangramia sp.]